MAGLERNATAAPIVPSDANQDASSVDASQATRAFEAFRAAFWDGEHDCFYRLSDHSGARKWLFFFRIEGYADFWWDAHLFELCLDAYERTRDGQARRMIDAVADGFLAHYSITANDFNDDLAWWAATFARAREVTGEDRFRDLAERLTQRILPFENSMDGGGITWKRDGKHPFKNMAANAPVVIALCRLARITGDARDLARARELYAWIAQHLVHGSRVIDGLGANDRPADRQYTYNYGTWIGANLALYEATGEQSYVTVALEAAGEAMKTLAPRGILVDEGDGDGSGFKMILTRYLARLAVFDPAIARFIARNAQAAWEHRRTSDSLMWRDWSRPAPSGPIESFAAASGVAVQFAALVASDLAATAPRRRAQASDPRAWRSGAGH